jgi:type IV secretory pathway TrbD component
MLAETLDYPFLYISAFGAAVLFAFICSAVAGLKGQNRLLWAGLGFVTWFVGLIVLAMMPIRSGEEGPKRIRQQRSWVIFGLLIAFVVMVYLMALVQMSRLTGF